MKSKIQDFKTKLVCFCAMYDVAMSHNESHEETGNYGIWYEMGESRLDADSMTAEKVPVISVQIWTKDEYSELPDLLEDFFDRIECAWDNETYADYDEELQRYHYGWTMTYEG